MRGRHLCNICCLVLVWFVLAGAIRGVAGRQPDVPVPEGQTIRVSGTVYRRESKKTGNAVYLKNISFDPDAAGILPETRQWNQNIIVYLREDQRVKLGGRVLAEGICACPEPAGNPGCFDARAYYRALHVGMYLKKAVILRESPSFWRIRNALADLRDFLRERLELLCRGNDAGILSAMLLGDRGILDEEIKNLYQDVGLIHLLAISGLHVSLTGMAFYRLLRRAGLPFAAAGTVTGILMAAYAFLTGYPVSAVRAVLMFGLFLLAQAAGRTYDMPTGLAAAAVVILLNGTDWMYQAGFLLSFAAVGGVLLSAAWKSRALRRTPLGINLAVQLTTLPLIGFFYYQVPLYAVPLNLGVIWAMPLILGFGLAGVAASFLSQGLGRLLLEPAHDLLLVLEFLSRRLRLLPFASVVTGQPGIWKTAAYYATLAAFLYLCEKFQKKQKKDGFLGKFPKIDLIKLSFAIILLSGIFTCNRRTAFSMTFLDVGQGDGCCIENEGRSVWMIDGGSSSESRIAGYCLEPFLKSRGNGRTDCWLVSHADADHVSGLLETLRSYERGLDGKNAAGITVGMILMAKAAAGSEAGAEISGLAQEHGIPLVYVKAGDVLQDGRMTVRILAPEADVRYSDANEASVVAQVTFGGFSALLTGDVGEEGEEMLLTEGLLEDIDVLKVAHHGSRNSTSAEFLKQTAPEVAVISCGRDNRYGHPHEELLARLRRGGCHVARTDRQGAVTVTVTKDRYLAEYQRKTG